MKSNKMVAAKRRIGTAVVAVSILFTFNQCVESIDEVKQVEVQNQDIVNTGGGNNNSGGDSGGDFGDDMPNDDLHNNLDDIVVDESDVVPEEQKVTGSTEAARSVSSVGVLHYAQIDATFAALTGVSRFDNNSINQVYQANSLGLPNENNIKTFGAANTMAVFKLASAYCSAMADNATARNAFFNGIIDITRTPGQVLNSATQKEAFVDGMINRLWGEGVHDGPMMDGYMWGSMMDDSVEPTMRLGARGELLALVDELLQGENLGRAETTENVAVATCAAMMSSSYVIYL